MQIAIYSRVSGDVNAGNVQRLLDELLNHGIAPVLYRPFYERVSAQLPQHSEPALFSSAADLKGRVEFLISMGGDGTLLDTVSFVRDTNIPIIGINFGRLGFLASIGKDDIHTLVQALIDRNFVIDKRGMLHLDANIPLFGEVPYALNEFTIHKKDTSAMIRIHMYLNGEFLNTYWADGLIVTTPTGSTAYSLSCGGPVVFPDTGSLVITPVAPHNLNVRPIVVPDHNIISFEVEGRSDQFLCTLDSRIETVDRQVQLAVRKEVFTLSLLRLQEANFMNTLRNKLLWGIDKRN
ncbi:NAD kinase [Compostibacter hankyongensis]|uniref:NAD kinase n=1 Tax=Compostibacter hankyongensis TaxID=1007089 RepID=A0ABP8FTE0_9BACT